MPPLRLWDHRLRLQASALPDVRRGELARTRAEMARVSDARHELQDWYGRRLRPKLLAAAESGAIRPAAAVALERQMRDLLASGRPAA
jgi:hypothetical protein